MSEPTFGSGIAMGFKLGATIKTVATAEAQKLLKAISGAGKSQGSDLAKENWIQVPVADIIPKDKTGK
ncbi:MAG: hypothetical protein HUU01_19385 [Saprospiraceae bacterium]|nr:hypothetical protein [Saprospiraceae bacterium]